jgi:hypothetical protein
MALLHHDRFLQVDVWAEDSDEGESDDDDEDDADMPVEAANDLPGHPHPRQSPIV